MQLAKEVSISGVFALGEEIKPEPALVIAGDSPAIVYALGDDTRLPAGTSIRFNVEAFRGGRTFLATTKDHQNYIEHKPDLSEGNPEFAIFGCSTHLFSCHTHGIRTIFPQNSFRVFLMDTDGNWQMEELAIIAQNRRAYLSRQLIYHGQTHLNGAAVSGPTFEMIRKSVNNRKEAILPQPISEKGIVKFFSLAAGWGSILVVKEDGEIVEAKAYWKHIYIPTNTGRPLVYLAHGEEVTCDLVPPDSNAKKKTSFKYEAIGIRPCS